MSRIDRVLVSENWESTWGTSSLWVLPRDVSDYCQLLLKAGGLDWGLNRFGLIIIGLETGGSKRWWRIVGGLKEREGGWVWCLKNKLKRLKGDLTRWSKVYEGLEVRLDRLKEDIEELDVKGELGLLTPEEVESRKWKFDELWKLLKSREASLVQRARSKWLKEGDANSKYFHRSVKLRAQCNSIRALKVEGVWVQTPEEVNGAVVEYFKKQVATTNWERPKLDGVVFEKLSESKNRGLIAPFSMEEIEVVVKESDGNKSPGPDDFNFVFIKEFWYLIKNEVRIMFDQFHENEVVPRSFLPYFVTLIPKMRNPFTLKEFRPISLLGCLYKLLSKVLAARLSLVMKSIISSS